jgi:hypothetical protein
VAAFRYRLLSSEGDDLGPFVSNHNRWKSGDTLPRNARDDFQVTAVVEPEDGATFAAYLVVEAVTPAATA